MDMLYISNLYKRFSDKKVLNGLNLSVPEHSIFGFIGKNGAGKTGYPRFRLVSPVKYGFAD